MCFTYCKILLVGTALVLNFPLKNLTVFLIPYILGIKRLSLKELGCEYLKIYSSHVFSLLNNKS